MNDVELINWAGEGYPPELQRILDRQPPMWAALAVRQGWWPLLARLDAQLAELDPNYTISQVKQKLGGLHYGATTSLTGDAREPFRRAVLAAQEEADNTCERCGRPGVLRINGGGYYLVLCDDDSAGFQIVTGDTWAVAQPAPRNKASANPRDELTAAEKWAAIMGGVSAAAFGEGGRRSAEAHLEWTSRYSDGILSTWLPLRDVSALVRVDEAELQRMSDVGELSTADVDGSPRFAPWQVNDDGRSILPGIGDVLRAMPNEYTALDVDVVMRFANEAFGGRAPRELLGTHEGLRKVIEWARDLGLS
ncbi:hypothetical protein [Microbacterium hatanonis]|uniref:Antitoxin Xre/MbcA/ParS-like toxin-binding domain-containing protein n=1 Tax=Microbacterium hatanonis TaxID=404366 RepID=A0A5C8I051_9MICO|nr:hypothetical protein [Microbacterium hatanonis]TXK12342.1 hypothetical protein FVP77_02355 [Microbacterium hatanonis]